jgi:hypothetical protein
VGNAKQRFQESVQDTKIQDDNPIIVLSQALHQHHLHHTITYTMCAQLFQDLSEQPVDDISVEWDPKKYPFEPIATLFEQQDSWIPSFKTWQDDHITVNSYHSLKSIAC